VKILNIFFQLRKLSILTTLNAGEGFWLNMQDDATLYVSANQLSNSTLIFERVHPPVAENHQFQPNFRDRRKRLSPPRKHICDKSILTADDYPATSGCTPFEQGWNLVGLKVNQEKSIADIIPAGAISAWKWENNNWAVWLMV